MATSIQISEYLQKELIKRKLSDKKTKKEIAFARVEIKEGRFHSLAEVKKELGL